MLYIMANFLASDGALLITFRVKDEWVFTSISGIFMAVILLLCKHNKFYAIGLLVLVVCKRFSDRWH